MSATPDSTFTSREQRIADLERQLAEALERETATAEVLQVINSSPGDLAPVFNAMLDNATRLCDAKYGILWKFDGEAFHTTALRGVVPPALAEFVRRPMKAAPGGAFSELMGGKAVYQAADTANSELYRSGASPLRRAFVDLGGTEIVLFVALRKDGALLGALAIYREENKQFTDRQVALVAHFADQAVIAIGNARLIAETREALEQQTATSEVLRVINSSPGDLAPVFDAMLEKAMRLCEADFGSLWTLLGDRFRPVAHHGLPPRYAEYLAHDVPAAGLGTGRARLLAGEQFAHIADLADEEPYRSGEPHRRALVNLGGARTALLVPLRQDDKVGGFIMIYRQEVRPFSDKQIMLLQNFAAQAVIAMENARLLTETREALEQQTATAEVLGVINSSPGDLQPVFDAILERAMRLCDNDNGGFFLLRDETYQLAASLGLDPAYIQVEQTLAIPPGNDTLVGRVALAGCPVHVLDAINDPEYGPKNNIRLSGMHTILGVPLMHDQAVVGVICTAKSRIEPFTDKQIALLENFAAQAVIAMENARLLGELRQRTEEVAELNRGLEVRVAEQVEELGRVGRLKRFLAPQLAELIVSQGDEKILESHRREIVVVFCDLRGYTAFTETAEPEEVLEFLRQYHGALGPLVSQFEGTLDQFSGDGIMVFFNDPVPCPDPAERAVKMAMAMREAAGKLIAAWRHDVCELGFGVGIAQGYATLGQIGFSDRSGYTAIGTVCNLASRLCAEAKDGQILISSRVARAVEAVARLENLGELELRGLRRPVAAFNVVQSAGAADARPNLTVVGNEPGA